MHLRSVFTILWVAFFKKIVNVVPLVSLFSFSENRTDYDMFSVRLKFVICLHLNFYLSRSIFVTHVSAKSNWTIGTIEILLDFSFQVLNSIYKLINFYLLSFSIYHCYLNYFTLSISITLSQIGTRCFK